MKLATSPKNMPKVREKKKENNGYALSFNDPIKS